MKLMFDEYSAASAKLITKKYSTSFSLAVKLLSPEIRENIYNIYGFVRVADEIVDSFHEYEKEALLDKFEKEYYNSLNAGISLNPILNAFQKTVKEFKIDDHLVQAFLKSMRTDLTKKVYHTIEEFNEYIYGSADVVGLMCLKVFVKGDQKKYEALKAPAMRLGSAFQKVNFLRDLNADINTLDRTYFPDVDFSSLSNEDKIKIIAEIEDDFNAAYEGLVKLPVSAKLGVFVAYRYYKKLLAKLKQTEAKKIMQERIRVSDPRKLMILADSYVRHIAGIY